MTDMEFVITLVSIISATILIRTWLKQNGGDERVDRDTFNRLGQAFLRHKQEMQERMDRIEERLPTGGGQRETAKDYGPIEAREAEETLPNDLQQNDKKRVR